MLLSLKRLDGKPLVVAAHSTDRDARWGRGAGQQNNGYKLHAITAGRPMPEQWALTPLNVDERVVARRLIQRLQGTGYLLCDGMFDSSDLHDRAAAVNHHLLCPRRKPGTGLGHRRHSEHRLRSMEMLEPPGNINDYGLRLYQQRGQIERDFGNLVSFGGGLQGLPAWVRRIWRVRAWVYGKLLINAVRIRRLQAARA
jgi:IS5 family transposase